MTSVAGQQSEHREQTRRRRRWAAIGASILVHGVIFAAIGLNTPGLIAPNLPLSQAVNIWLVPRLTPEQHRPARHPEAPKPLPVAAPKAARPAPQPSPVQAAAVPGKVAPGPAKPGPPPTEAGAEGGVREALRTSVGCDADRVVHLTPGEQDHCNKTFGEMAKKGPPFSGLDPLKRGRFDAQAEADERRRANRTGPLQDLVVPCTGEGSNLGGGCLPDSAIMHIHQH